VNREARSYYIAGTVTEPAFRTYVNLSRDTIYLFANEIMRAEWMRFLGNRDAAKIQKLAMHDAVFLDMPSDENVHISA